MDASGEIFRWLTEQSLGGVAAGIATFVLLLVLLSLAVGPSPMALVFNGYEIAALLFAGLITMTGPICDSTALRSMPGSASRSRMKRSPERGGASTAMLNMAAPMQCANTSSFFPVVR